MTGFVIEQEVIVPSGEYPARVVSVHEHIVRGRLESLREVYLRWVFQIEGGAHAGRRLAGWTRPRFARGTRLFAWVGAALGHEIAPDYTLNTVALPGRRVLLRVRVVQDDATGELRNQIVAVLPWAAGQGGA